MGSQCQRLTVLGNVQGRLWLTGSRVVDSCQRKIAFADEMTESTNSCGTRNFLNSPTLWAPNSIVSSSSHALLL